MKNVPDDGLFILNQRTGEEFVVFPASKFNRSSTTTKVIAATAIGVVVVLSTSILCRLLRKLFA